MSEDVFGKKVVKIGGSLAVYIPSVIFKKSNFHEDCPVTIRLINKSTIQIQLDTADVDDKVNNKLRKRMVPNGRK